jgi:thiol-disulfide isomerase/thioredoxin
MNKRHLLITAVLLIVLVVVFIEVNKPARIPSNQGQPVTIESQGPETEQKARQYTIAREITEPKGFINTDSITISQLIGKKVILMDFWTYSCINCQRTLPYLTSWYDKYRDQGLEIIGVHTPEFEFEKNKENVQWAVDKYGIEYPVVQDNDYGTWTAYANRYWPRKYLIDIDGFIVYDHIGEGAYDQTEKKIQELLQERQQRLGEDMVIASGMVDPEGTEISRALSPETYFGALRNQYLGNGKPGKDGLQNLTAPNNLNQNILYLDGEWIFSDEFSTNRNSSAKILYRYRAEKVFLVMSGAQDIKVEVLRDGKPLTADIAGQDIIFENNRTYVDVQQERLYRLIEDDKVNSHDVELIISQPGLNVYALTFG